MTSWSGNLAPSAVQLSDFTYISDELNEFAVDYWPPYLSESATPGGAGLTVNAPVALGGATRSGRLAVSYLDDYYYRIHIIETTINLGNVTSQQSVDVEVWNSWFVSKLLSGITATNDEGLVLSEPIAAPTTFGPLESRIYSLQATSIGPSNVDASYDFLFPAETVTLLVIGTRVIVLPFKARIDSSVIERLEWLTDVMESFDGSEQRVTLRGIPRRQFVFNFLENGDDQRLLDSLLHSWQSRVYALPVWMDTGELTQLSASGSTVLYCVTDYLDYHEGGLVYISDDNGTFETGTVLSLTSSSITLEDALDNTWVAGSKVYPALTARLQPSQAITRRRPRISQGQFTATVIDNWAITASDIGNVYRDNVTLTTKPRAYEDITDEYVRTMSVLDNQTGVQFYDDTSGFSASIRDFLWLIEGREEIWDFREFLHARRGRAVPLWIPTWREDIRIVDPITSADTSITIAYMGYTQHLAQAINRRDIRILYGNSETVTAITFRILSSSTDGETETLGLDAPVGVDISVSQIKTVSFIEMCRLNADAIEIEWLDKDLIKCRHKVRSLNYDV